jgi:hypothetical protein
MSIVAIGNDDEKTMTRCDTCYTIVDSQPPEEIGWIEDDMGGHMCRECQKNEQDFRQEEASAADLKAFSLKLSEEAERILQSPKVLEAKAERLSSFLQKKTAVLKEAREKMREHGLGADEINSMLSDFEARLDSAFEMSLRFTIE